MRSFGYLIAGMALLASTVAQLVKPPAPNASLGNGWRYKGCYLYELPNLSLVTLIDRLVMRTSPTFQATELSGS